MSDDPNEEPLDPDEFTDLSPDQLKDVELSVVCDALQEHGIKSVVVRYSGSGDQGSVEEVAFEPADVQLPGWIETTLEDVAECYCPQGYENNEGGYGTLTIHPFEGVAELEHCDHFEDSEAIDTRTPILPQELRRRLVQLGVQRVLARFDGYGDSGQIDLMEVEPETVKLDKDLHQDLENFLLEELPSGWEINAGSYGEFTVDVAAGHIELDAFWRIEKDSEPQFTRWKWRQ